MQQMLFLTAPFFAVVALGWFAARWRMLGDGAVRSLNVFCFYFAMPALVIGALRTQQLDQLFEPSFLMAWLSAGLALFAVGALSAGAFLSVRLNGLAVSGQAAAIGNLGFLGLPLLITAFGDKSASWIALILIVDLVVLIPISILLLEIHKGRGSRGLRGFFTSVASIVRGTVLNPFLLAIAGGLLLAWWQPPAFEPLDRFITFLAGAAAPTALFALGASLSGRAVTGDMGAVIWISALKLVAHPLAVWFALDQFGVVDPLAIAVAISMAAMPVAGNVFVIAEQYGAMVRRVSSVVLVSTVISVVTAAYALSLFTNLMR